MHQRYLVTFTLPDGKHLAHANAHPSVALAHIRHAIVSNNPDAQLDDADIMLLRDEAHIAEAIAALKAENPDRPLANELGLDTPNRILTNPEIARNLAAQQQQAASMSAGGGCC